MGGTHERDLRRGTHRKDEARARFDDEQPSVDRGAILAEIYNAHSTGCHMK